ncbi:serine hydrolase [Aliikangiella sp. G2MR2-5]|uniref:serine hydrolase domain-containing protein n=1 Tax=Aliikangiella sp. G2MR2-5 TaxID=2788943 RepID=UPI0018A9350F|nr:serine hydrolase [Aliikangiella sp. G2MR2-5]
MPISWLKKVTSIIGLVMLVAACTDGTPPPQIEAKPYAYTAPKYTGDGWQVGHLADFNINQQAILDLVSRISRGTHPGIDSLTIVKNNTLLLHENFRTEFSEYDSWVNNTDLNLHVMHSTSKSIVSALVGIAKQQGFIGNIQTPLLQFFDYPEYENWDPGKNDITLENTLTMQLGLEWDEWNFPYEDTRNSLHAIVYNHSDYIKAMLDLPMTSKPGEVYAYNTIASIALGAVIERATGYQLEDFAEQFLFEPLQISEAHWLETPDGFANTGSGLFLKTRDMAKFGQLFLDGGVWNGLQIIERDWIDRSLEKSVTLDWSYTSGYGYQWWLGEFLVNEQVIPFYSTRGFGGQFIIVVPGYDLVLAFTAHNYDNGLYDSPFSLTEKYILPAITQ